MSHDFARSQRLKREAARKKPVRKSGGVPSWLWVLIGTLAGGLIMFLVYLSGLAPSLPAPGSTAVVDKAAESASAAAKTPAAPPKRASPVFEFYTKLPEGGATTGVPAEAAAPAAANTNAPVVPPPSAAPADTPAGTADSNAAPDPIQQLLAEQEQAKAAAPSVPTAAPQPVASTATKDTKETAASAAASKPAGRHLQAGAFRSKTEVEKLRAKIALTGLNTAVQTSTNAKGETLHKVLVGPFKSADDMDEARIILTGNGVNTIPVK